MLKLHVQKFVSGRPPWPSGLNVAITEIRGSIWVHVGRTLTFSLLSLFSILSLFYILSRVVSDRVLEFVVPFGTGNVCDFV